MMNALIGFVIERDSMQYILTQEEYNELLAKKKTEIGLYKEKLQNLCTKIANEMPITRSWDKNNKSPWGCILTQKDKDGYLDWYCDNCPVQYICPYEYKEFSQ